MEKLDSSLRSFFTFVIDLVTEWTSLEHSARGPLKVMSDTSEQLQLSQNAEWNAELLSKFPDIKGKLDFKLYSILEEEVARVYTVKDSLESLCSELRTHQQSVEKSCYKADIVSLPPACPIGPTYDQMVMFSEQIYRHYHAQLLKVNLSLRKLDYKDANSLSDLKNSLITDIEQARKIGSKKQV